jgi:hypothetical protein
VSNPIGEWSEVTGRGGPVPISTDHISDDYMNDRISKAKSYDLMVLRPTAK